MPYPMNVASRTDLGKQAKHLHERGEIPAVVYGHGIESRAVRMARSDFLKIYRTAGTSSLIDLTVDSASSVKALIQEVQVNPISMEPYHVDFRQVRMDEALVVDVPLAFVGEAPAVKELAGTLVHPIPSVKVSCLPADLPHEIAVDLAALKTFDDAITVGTLLLPKGVKVLDDPNVTIAVVTPPLTEEQLKKMDEESKVGDVTTIKTEAEEKKEAETAKAAEEKALEESARA